MREINLLLMGKYVPNGDVDSEDIQEEKLGNSMECNLLRSLWTLIVTCLLHRLTGVCFLRMEFYCFWFNPLHGGSHDTRHWLLWTMKNSFQHAFADLCVCVFQVSVNGLEVLCLMVDRMGEEFKPHITTGM